MLDQESVSVREIARLVGKTTATVRAIPLAPLHYRALQLLMNSVLPLNYTQKEIFTKYETLISLTPASKLDLRVVDRPQKVPPTWNTSASTRLTILLERLLATLDNLYSELSPWQTIGPLSVIAHSTLHSSPCWMYPSTLFLHLERCGRTSQFCCKWTTLRL